MAGSQVGDKIDYRQIGPVILAMFADCFCIMVIFPFVPFMVEDFLDVDRTKIGFYSGFLVSAYHVGVLFGSMVWGSVADRFGRRPAILTSMTLMMVFTMLFGFSQSFTWAVVARLMLGLSSAVLSIGNTILSESSSNATMARVFSLEGVMAGLGRLIGPACGGLLSQPADKFAALNTPFFRRFPYLLPICVSVTITLISTVWAFFYLRETLHRPSSSPTSQEEVKGNEVAPWEDNELLQRGSDDELTCNGGFKTAEDGATTKPSLCCLMLRPLSCCRSPGRGFTRMTEEGESRSKHQSVWKYISAGVQSYVSAFALLRYKTVRHVCTLYGMLAFVSIMHNEVIPLLLVVSFAHGGLCFNTAEIGILAAGIGACQFTIQLFCYPRLANRFGYRRVFRGGLVCIATAALLTPWLTNFTGNQDPTIVYDNSTDSSVMYRSTIAYDNASNSTTGNSMSTPLDVCVRHVTRVANESVAACGSVESHNTTSTSSFQFAIIPCLPWSVWLITLLVVSTGYLARTVSFTSVSVIMNNSCERDVRARVNAIGLVALSLGAVVGPLVISNVFAWSVADTNDYSYPLNHHLTFLTMAVLAVLVMLWSWGLPASVEARMVSAKARSVLLSAPSTSAQSVLVHSNGSEVHNPLVSNGVSKRDCEETDTAV